MGDISSIPMEEILQVLQQLQVENANLRSAFDQLQTAPNLVPAPRILKMNMQFHIWKTKMSSHIRDRAAHK